MMVLWFVLTLLAIIALIIGLISPKAVVRWGDRRTRGKVALTYGGLAVLCFVLFIVTGTHSSTVPTSSGSISNTGPNWNMSDLNVASNGNLPIAIQILKSSSTSIKSDSKNPAPDKVFKEPWTYYGKVVKISGVVAIVQDYPPDSNVSKAMGGSASEMVLVANDGTYVDFLMMGDSGNVKTGDTVSIYGYPVGQDNVTNKLGGKTTELVIVGNTFDDPATP